jgi:hypothetical protein
MLFGSHNLYWLVTTCIHILVRDQFLKGSQDTIVMPKTIAHVANKTLLPFLVKKGLGEDANNVLLLTSMFINLCATHPMKTQHYLIHQVLFLCPSFLLSLTLSLIWLLPKLWITTPWTFIRSFDFQLDSMETFCSNSRPCDSPIGHFGQM